MDDISYDRLFNKEDENNKLEKIYKPMQTRDDLPSNRYNTAIRYRPGKLPHWLDNEEDNNDENIINKEDNRLKRLNNNEKSKRRDRKYEPIIIENNEKEIKKDIEKLDNKIENKIDMKEDDNEEIIIKNEINENEIKNRRERVKRVEEEEEELLPREEEEEDIEEGEEEEEEGEEEEEEEEILYKPVFVPKSLRTKIIDKEQQEKLKKEKEEKEKREKELKKEKAHIEVLKILEKEEIDKNMKDLDIDTDKPDDNDDNQEEEYELWKLRELQRLNNYYDQKEQAEKEKKETIRRSKLTDEERRKEDEKLIKLGLKKGEKEKKQMSFMQKYYHKGAFYMDEDSIKDKNDVRNLEYFEPTAGDAKITEATPAIMQKRNYGKKSQTKWTHLKAEDTTNWDNSWFQDSNIRGKYDSKLGGSKGDLNTAGRKKRKIN